MCHRCRTKLKAISSPSCTRCGFPLGTGQPLAGFGESRSWPDGCAECDDWPIELTTARSACGLIPPANVLVHGLKYGGWTALAPVLAERMVRVTRGLDVDIAVPVPTSKARRKARGYTQAELLGRELAQRLQLPFRDALERVRGGPTQVSLPPDQRLANVRNAFAVRGDDVGQVVGRSVLLIDDVLTTGATAGEIAKTLAEAGATAIHLRSFARALPT